MKTNSIIISTAIFSVALVVAAFIGVSAIRAFKTSPRTVSVKGMALRDFVSDLAVWNFSYSVHSSTPLEGYREIERQRALVLSFLKSQGVTDQEISLGAVSSDEKVNGYYSTAAQRYIEERDGYIVSQSVTITTGDVYKADKLSKSIGDLIAQGVTVSPSFPEYYYNGLGDLKLEMLGEAAADARERAEKIAGESNSRISGLKSSSMGVFQINGKNSNEEYSWGGNFNTSSIEKTATITVTSSFLLK